MANTESNSTDPKGTYGELRRKIKQLEGGDIIKLNVFDDTTTVVDTNHDEVPYTKSIKTVQAEVSIKGPRGGLFTLSAGKFSKDDQTVEVRSVDGDERKVVSSLERLNVDDVETDDRWPPIIDRARGKTPPDPTLPEQEGWSISTICYRTKTGPSVSDPVECPATETDVPLTDEHLYVTATRDPYPNRTTPSREFSSWVFPSPEALKQWVESPSEGS